MFSKVLIANRGAIACRIIRTLKALGVQSVAVYSEADAQARHVREADEAYLLGPAPAAESYLRADRILQIAQDCGAQAIHPGYGFLSENPGFAEACEAAGIAFIGPTPAQMRAFGLKHTARDLAQQRGVPLLPGSGLLGDLAQAQTEAQRIGFPVMLKSTAGGGGIGMRLVWNAAELADAFENVGRLAQANFKDAGLFIEKYVEQARHIEVQVFGDGVGGVIALGERDCSVQRRNQKVIEETPAPGLSDAQRSELHATAVRLAQAVDYRSAGTVEFVYDAATGAFYFLEVNTRLQVEHPVTEAITGLDLVEWQLRVASGEPLPLTQEQLHIDGHAIEARICAETPDNQFLPATGRLDVYRKPACTSFERGAVRVDDGVREGDAISPFYDSMVAKLIVHGRTRAEALARLDAALAETRIVGLSTNVQFLRHVVASPSFAQANLDTALIPREAGVLFNQDKVGLNLAVAAAVAQTLLAERASEGKDPFSRRDGWRPHGLTVRRFDFEYLGEAMQASLTYLHDGALQLALGEVSGLLTFHALPAENGTLMDLRFMGQRQTVQTWQREEIVHIFCALGATQITELDALAHAGEAAHDVGRLTAPMPGKVVSFAVKAGDAVKKGQPLAVMEAMKMEHTIAAPADGTVAELLYAPGDQVAEGAELLKIQTA
ncbi:MAG TPA: 3-methylcrotonyl-CoA carboxylase [Hydrogenophaga sp.]|uniref:acetyl/propionyl/methylcrotonyl-CoA carboxylase subunit alpha n=1 Tax=Hydrogenophaga sp. TaxID=1904254 RepID=UPI000E931C3F|nr:biotin carboxylase N-terminal domain-containing protein [Hydrogenophaga sp.]HAX21462.1 3-methylcrotonyl-CoA carboxylase [Hydrogenophaga sp.]